MAPRLLLLLLQVLLVLGDGKPSGAFTAKSAICTEDPNHNIGDSWECDDKCNTCTCEPDGLVLSTEKCCGKNCGPATDDFEATVVQVGAIVALLCVAALLVLCFFMCCKGGSHKSAELVREMEEGEA